MMTSGTDSTPIATRVILRRLRQAKTIDEIAGGIGVLNEDELPQELAETVELLFNKTLSKNLESERRKLNSTAEEYFRLIQTPPIP